MAKPKIAVIIRDYPMPFFDEPASNAGGAQECSRLRLSGVEPQGADFMAALQQGKDIKEFGERPDGCAEERRLK